MTSYVVATAFGGPEVLEVRDEQLGEPGPGQVLVDVRAAGVNPVDHKLYGGMYGENPSQLPMRLGFEAAGVVRAVGEGAEGPGGPVQVGDEVIVYRAQGAYAAQLLVEGTEIVPKPAVLSFEEAAGIMLAGTTAVHMLEATGVGHGDTVLVHGAAGGVGLLLVQIAKARGAHVIGTAGVGNHAALQRYGVTPVEYGEGLVERVRELSEDVTVALDCVGSDEAVDASLELVADRSRIATIAAFARAAGDGIKALGGGPGADPGTAIRDAARLELVALVEEGQLEVTVAGTFPLAESAAAHRSIQGNHTHGKIVLLP
ncbi:NADP-dependent oxidoreductase [Rhodococcus antarcticus]|jgi:NADPH2:quinone reductase|uniref:NADP-dependent oxidoreductase n=1 Tax=Rhodococcus antarcticus TaxID=2987751 RepID=A0ABY6NXQ4_9NOCA|nr:NADP-dependent oxidoreductase [Rhodococcus antarcticus]UZJ24180.1 NADP-dependent oxidoreductase [Rhodococcus antarcticus]